MEDMERFRTGHPKRGKERWGKKEEKAEKS